MRIPPILRSERAQLSAVAFAVLIPFALLAVWAATLSPAPWEPGWLAALATGPGLLGKVSAALNVTGNLPVWSVVIVVSAVTIGLRRGARAGVLVGLSIASDVAALTVKVIVERERPDTAATHQFFGADDFSFPSGHTVRAAAFAAALVFTLAPRRWRLPLALLSGGLAGAVMGYARVSLGVHWPTDVLGGTLLGLGWFAVTTLIVYPDTHAPQLDSASDTSAQH